MAISPGIRILDTTLDLLRLDPLVQKATPVLLELRKTVRERVDLSLFDETRLVYALRMQSKRETFYATLVGHSVPAFCTAGGRAALSVLPEQKARSYVERTPLQAYTSRTLTDVDEIMMQITHARELGYAVVVDEFVQGEVAIGVAVSERAVPSEPSTSPGPCPNGRRRPSSRQSHPSRPKPRGPSAQVFRCSRPRPRAHLVSCAMPKRRGADVSLDALGQSANVRGDRAAPNRFVTNAPPAPRRERR